MKEKKKQTIIKTRNWHAVNARQRRSGPMKEGKRKPEDKWKREDENGLDELSLQDYLEEELGRDE